jgi:hypothetical protein
MKPVSREELCRSCTEAVVGVVAIVWASLLRVIRRRPPQLAAWPVSGRHLIVLNNWPITGSPPKPPNERAVNITLSVYAA